MYLQSFTAKKNSLIREDNGFAGLEEGTIEEMNWMSVNGWTVMVRVI